MGAYCNTFTYHKVTKQIMDFSRMQVNIRLLCLVRGAGCGALHAEASFDRSDCSEGGVLRAQGSVLGAQDAGPGVQAGPDNLFGNSGSSPLFDIPFQFHGFTPGIEFHSINDPPGNTFFHPGCLSPVMFFKATIKIFGLTVIVPVYYFTK